MKTVSSIIMILFSIFLIFLAKKDIKKMFWVSYLFIIGIPIGSTNVIMEYVNLINIKSVSINGFHVIISILTIYSIIELVKKRKIISWNRSYIKYIVFCVGIFTGLVIGLLHHKNFISDGQKYVMMMLYIFSIFVIFGNDFDIEKWIRYTIYGVSFGCLFSIFVNTLGDSMNFFYIEELHKRSTETAFVVYSANITLLIIIYVFYGFLNSPVNKSKIPEYVGMAVCMYYNLFCAHNRTIIFVMALLMIIVLVLSISKDNWKSTQFRVKIIATVSVIAMVAAVMVVTKNELLMRLLNTDIFSKNDNGVTRFNTVKYYFRKLVKEPAGAGFGTPLPLINQWGRFHGISLFTDNAYVNVAMKTGIIGLAAFVFMIIVPVVKFFKNHGFNRKNVIIGLTYLGYLFLVTVMTGQFTNTYPITLFSISLVYALNVYANRNEQI